MGKINLDAYIFFRGNCREAMEFYKDVFGGELTMQTHGEAMGDQAEADWRDKIMHASLEGGDIKLMASDTKKASEKAAKITLSLGGEDEARLGEIFNKLSAGGEVFQPLKKQFWGDIFGQLTDKYGIEWMVNITTKKG